jgi:anti-sigma regulatory factor (Ser/Thr protein kinase)
VTPEPTAAIDLPLDVGAPADGRRVVRDLLAAWHVSDATAVEISLLVVSELITNAVVHGGGQVRLEAALHEDALHLAVSDGSSVLPGRRDAAPLDMNGRGLQLIEALTRGWGVEDTGSGKRVWVDVPL